MKKQKIQHMFCLQLWNFSLQWSIGYRTPRFMAIILVRAVQGVHYFDFIKIVYLLKYNS